MWSTSSTDLKNFELVLDERRNYPGFDPTPYTFTKLEKGKKTVINSTSLTPPSWLLLDHTIAVIWFIFSPNPYLRQLNIDDLKWAYEFLKGIRKKKGENPPDVKVCLKEIQDRLINLYANLTSLKEEDLDEIAAAFGEKIIRESPFEFPSLIVENKIESQFDTSLYSSISPKKMALRLPYGNVMQKNSCKDTTEIENSKLKRIAMNYTKKTFPLIEKDSNLFEEEEEGEDEEVEKYILSLFDDYKNDDTLQQKLSLKSLIPMKRNNPGTVFTEIISGQDTSGDTSIKTKTSKKVHCVAELRSLKFQKSTKVQDTNGEEAAYSNLKAEIRRLTIDPKVSRNDIMKFLQDWRSEQVDRLHNELKRLNSIEEIMKSVTKDEVKPKLPMNSPLKLKELNTTNSCYSLSKS